MLSKTLQFTWPGKVFPWIELYSNWDEDMQFSVCPCVCMHSNWSIAPALPIQHMESRTLAIARSLTRQLQNTCLSLAPSLQGLPQNIQHQALSVALSASEIYSNFSGAFTFQDLSDSALASSRGQLARIKESLDGVMDYLVNNTPLNWLVGPFYPRAKPCPAPIPNHNPDHDTGTNSDPDSTALKPLSNGQVKMWATEEELPPLMA